MNGADRLCDVLLANDVDVCFANPGTSEMHFVAALDRKPRMCCVLGLFEGVVTGAADGYARMADKPAATLLHLGPGLANGLANLHNARRAHTPMINVVGDHATYHLQYDAPLTSDIESLARPMSDWVRRIADAESVGPDTAAAYQAAMSLPGVTTLILPADAAWSEVSETAITRAALAEQEPVAAEAVMAAANAIRSGRRALLMLTGQALRADALEIAGRIAAATGLRLTAQAFNGRIERGVGRVPVERVPYPIDLALEMLRDIDVLILVGARVPVTFFAYPGKPGRLVRDDCEVIELAQIGQDLKGALAWLADELGVRPDRPAPIVPSAAIADTLPQGRLTADAISLAVARMMPENAIICDESITSGRQFFALSQNSVPARDHGQAEADGERGEDAHLQGAGRGVRLPGIHVRANVFGENRPGPPGATALEEEHPAHGREDPRADRPSGNMARDHSAGGQVEPHATRLGELLLSRHRQPGVPGARHLHSGAVAPVVALQAQAQATQGRGLSPLAPLRALRARPPEPAWA